MKQSRPLRVLHVVQHLEGYGAERQLTELARALNRPELVCGVMTVYARDGAGDPAGFPVLCAGRRTRRDYSFIRPLLEGVREFSPDVVHTHTLSGKYWGRFAAIANGIQAIVHTEHNPCDPKRTFLQRAASRVLDPKTTRFVTFFPEQAEMLAKTDGMGIGRFAIVPNGLEFGGMLRYGREAARGRLGISDETFAILLVGRMAFQKNHQLALRALAAIEPSKRDGLLLLLAGSGALEPELRALAQSLQIVSHVRFLGYRSDVAELMAGSDLLLMTSHFEGMPLTLLEAMHAELPILTTPWLGARSMLGNGAYGRIAPAWDPAALAAEISGASCTRASMRATAVFARHYALREFSLARMVSAHRALYASLAGSRVRAA